MLLQAVLDSLEGLDEALHSYYSQTDGGNFALRLEGIDSHPRVTGLKSAFEKRGREVEGLKARLEPFGDMSADDLQALRDAAAAAGEGGDVTEQLAELRTQLEARAAAAADKAKTRESELLGDIERLVVDLALESALSEAGVPPHYIKAVKAELKQEFGMTAEKDAETGQWGGQVKTAVGPMGIKSFVKDEWVQSEAAQHFLPPDQRTGSGAPPESGGDHGRRSGGTETFDRNDPTAWGRMADKVVDGKAQPK